MGCGEPRAKFCWLCGNKLWGTKHVEQTIDGHPRIMHVECAKDPGMMYLKKGQTMEEDSLIGPLYDEEE